MELVEANLFELEPDEEYDKFCGKVFVTTKKKIIFHCTLCESKFFGFESYVEHITSQHLTDSSESFEEEFLESENDEDLMLTDEKEVPTELLPKKNEIRVNRKNSSSQNSAKTQKRIDAKAKIKVVNEPPPLPTLSEIEDRSRRTQIVKSEKGVFECPHCPQRFSLEYSLKAHIKDHDADRIFKCNICGVQFKVHRHLRVHIKRHEKNKAYKCTECERSFIQPSELQYHMRNHNGEKPYQCENCGVRYAYKSTLVLHRKRHHTFQKDYVCPICNEAFYCGRFLRDHMTKHTNEPSYECEKCGKKFKSSSCFGRHKAQHRQQEETESNAALNIADHALF